MTRSPRPAAPALALLGLLLLVARPGHAAEPGADAPPAPELTGATWFNGPPTSLRALRGKVVLVNVFVHSCENCVRSIPTLKRWAATYRAKGLEIVGVHTPEFPSDRPADSVARALKREGITWPVVLDNEKANWNAWNVDAWPTFFLVDRQGRIRSVHAGEISSRFPAAIPGLEADLAQLLAEPGTAG